MGYSHYSGAENFWRRLSVRAAHVNYSGNKRMLKREKGTAVQRYGKLETNCVSGGAILRRRCGIPHYIAANTQRCADYCYEGYGRSSYFRTSGVGTINHIKKEE